MKKLLIVCLMLALALPIAAQDGLSDEDQATVDRLVELIQTSLDYESYSFRIDGETYNNVEQINPDGTLVFEVFQYNRYSYTGAASLGDEPFGWAEFTANISDYFNDEGGDYRTFGEIRYVDGQFYLSADALGDEEMVAGIDIGSSSMEGTWTTTDDLGLLEALGLMAFHNIFNRDENTPTLDVTLQTIVNEDTSIVIAEVEEDGETYELIQFALDGESAISLFSEMMGMSPEADPFAALLFEAIIADEGQFLVFTMDFMIDGEGMLAGVRLYLDFFARVNLGTTRVPIPGSAQGELVIAVTISQNELRTNINEPLEPVEVPE